MTTSLPPRPTYFNPYYLVRPFLFHIDPEVTHHLSIAILKMGLGPRLKPIEDSVLKTTLSTRVDDLTFPNPIGLAAGFDKQAEVISPLLNFGFGHIELGSILPLPQSGNPKPRLFRIPEADAVINRFGFNSDGISVCLKRIADWRQTTKKDRQGIVGINIGKNKESTDATADYVAGVRAFAPFADYLTVNISSPNTPGLRDLQRRELLSNLLTEVMVTRNSANKKPPLFVKVAPDLSLEQQEDIVDVALSTLVDGIIVGNTTISRPDFIRPDLAKEAGGLSGRPLFDLSTKILANFYRLTKGKIPLIGCGGVFTGADAYTKIKAGASLVQIYTSLVYEGPGVVSKINKELAALLKRDGHTSVLSAVGTGTTP